MTTDTTTQKASSSSRKNGTSLVQRFEFLGHYLCDPARIGSLTPSSAYLTHTMLQDLDLARARLIVELGPGTGPFTRKIVERMGADSSLVCFELDDGLCGRLAGGITDTRVRVVNRSALDMPAYLRMQAYGKADCIVSGLPLKSIEKREHILEAVVESLAPKGVFVQFQYNLPGFNRPIERLLARHFLAIDKSEVYRNLPPATVYACAVPVHPPSPSRQSL